MYTIAFLSPYNYITHNFQNLLKSLGKVFYDKYSEKLRQLKFCEESAF